jgi:DNA-binding response OmpR family regulator
VTPLSRNASHAHIAKNSRVLVVEDEWLIADEVCHQLLKAGYRVVGPVPSVHEALSFIDEDEVDAALLDYSLNDEDSCQIAEELAAHDIPFAFLTGYDPKEIPHCGKHPCLQKPISPEILLRMLDALLEKRESQTSS